MRRIVLYKTDLFFVLLYATKQPLYSFLDSIIVEVFEDRCIAHVAIWIGYFARLVDAVFKRFTSFDVKVFEYHLQGVSLICTGEKNSTTVEKVKEATLLISILRTFRPIRFSTNFQENH